MDYQSTHRIYCHLIEANEEKKKKPTTAAKHVWGLLTNPAFIYKNRCTCHLWHTFRPMAFEALLNFTIAYHQCSQCLVVYASWC